MTAPSLWYRIVVEVDRWCHNRSWISHLALDPLCDYCDHLITGMPYRRIRAETKHYRNEMP